MSEADILQYFGWFIVSWAAGYSLSLKILSFKKLSEIST